MRKYFLSLVALCATFVFLSDQANAQGNNGNLFFGSVIGGVKVDAENILNSETVELDENQRQQLQDRIAGADRDINNDADWRVISFRGLEAVLAESVETGKALPAEVQYMAGLQRIEVVMYDEENNDILLAGPGEGWEVTPEGLVVGSTTGQPVLQLEDFLVAMRTADNARQGQGISVSIDPTEEGARNLRRFYRQNGFTPEMKEMVEDAMGPQNITLTGVPEDSRFAQLLTIADYKMKRLSMGLDASPVAGMPSLLEILQTNNARLSSMAPRFWMETYYEPLAVNADKTVWQIRGQGVKTLTEDGFINRQGEAVDQGRPNKWAQQWADSMTERYEELCTVEPVFCELRNLMDMSVVAAIISREGLLQKAGMEIPMIAGTVTTPAWNAPRTVSTHCSFVRMNNSWLVTASGGVQVDSWAVAENMEEVESTQEILNVASERTADRWWWNAAP